MKRMCAALDCCVDVKECVECAEDCGNPIMLDEEEMIMSLYSICFPQAAYVDSKQAYEKLRGYIIYLKSSLERPCSEGEVLVRFLTRTQKEDFLDWVLSAKGRLEYGKWLSYNQREPACYNYDEENNILEWE